MHTTTTTTVSISLLEVHWSALITVVYLQVDVLSWISAKHNMGMAFDRNTWNQIKACATVSTDTFMYLSVSHVTYSR